MSFAGIASNQCVSYTNLQDAVTTGIFTLVSAITSTGQQSTKSYVAAHVSGFNPNYPPYALKASNQLVVKGDIYNTGSVTLSPQYGMYFSGITATGFPSFSYPVNNLQVANYVNTIPAQTFTVNLNGTRTLTPLNITLYIDTTKISCQDITTDGSQSFSFTLSNNVYGPSAIFLAIDYGACSATNPVFSGKPFYSATVNSGSGQYMVAANSNLSSNNYTQGYLYYSSNYGSTWTQSTAYGYWKKVAASGNGQYMLAVELYGKAYQSSNYGATWSDTGLGTNSYSGCAISNDGYYRTITIADSSGTNARVKRSVNFASWTDAIMPSSGNSRNYNGVAMSSSGQYQTVVTGVENVSTYYGGGVLYSSDYGANFSLSFQGAYIFIDVTSSPDGTKQIAVAQSAYNFTAGQMFKSTNYGVAWSTLGSSGDWFRASANDTTTNYAIVNPTTNYIQSIASLSTVSNLTSGGLRDWRCIAISNNGTYILAGTLTGLYLSTNGGTSFSAL